MRGYGWNCAELHSLQVAQSEDKKADIAERRGVARAAERGCRAVGIVAGGRNK